MIRFYSLFVTDDNLLASPYARRFNVFHDITLQRGETETVNFLLQTAISMKQYKQLHIMYDLNALTVEEVAVKRFKHQSLITVTLIPKEIGAVKIGLAFPQSVPLHYHRMDAISSPMTSVPCHTLQSNSSKAVTAVPSNAAPVGHQTVVGGVVRKHVVHLFLQGDLDTHAPIIPTKCTSAAMSLTFIKTRRSLVCVFLSISNFYIAKKVPTK